jgi:hypothetical protein
MPLDTILVTLAIIALFSAFGLVLFATASYAGPVRARLLDDERHPGASDVAHPANENRTSAAPRVDAA